MNLSLQVEVSSWITGTPNHVYLLDDSMSSMYGYIPAGSDQLQMFKAPIKFSIKHRKFKFVKKYSSDEKTVEIKGSKGNVYYVTINDKKTCSCPGFKYRQDCKHIGMV